MNAVTMKATPSLIAWIDEEVIQELVWSVSRAIKKDLIAPQTVLNQMITFDQALKNHSWRRSKLIWQKLCLVSNFISETVQ